MRTFLVPVIGLWLAVAVLPLCAQQKLDTMVAGGETYKNVTVTDVTATHVQFLHSRGSGSVKLKSLSPELQKQFGYDAGASAAAEQGQRESDSRFRAEATTKKPVTKRAPAAEAATETTDDDADIVVPKLYAKSYRGKKAPKFQSEKWISAAPDTQGKFVLIDFWATWCGPCRASIPHLNQLQAKFKDRLVVIGLSDETEQQVKAMKSPKIEYSLAIDTQGRMSNEAQVRGIPHAMLLDPDGIVRFEGMPSYLTEKGLERVLDKYAK